MLVGVGARTLFAAAAEGAGLSLWTIDHGSDRVEPLAGCPDGCPSGPPLPPGSFDPPALAGHRGVLYFAGTDPGHGTEPWTSDGTGAGTRRLADLCAGPCDGSPHAFLSAGEALLFEAQGSLWATDGRPRGTAALARLRPLPPGSVRSELDVATAGPLLVFEGFDDEHGVQLWASDLTPAGTRPAAALGTLGASSRASGLVAAGDRALFQACGPAGAQLWASDGSEAGTAPLRGPAALPCEPFPFTRLTLAGGLAYAYWDGRLWRSDGTAAGTFPVDPPIAPLVRDAVDLGGRLLFVLDPSFAQPPPWLWELWESDGTVEGTRLAFRLPLAGTPYRLAVAGAEAFFIAQAPDPPYSFTLFRTDGSEAGTRPLRADLDQAVGLVTARLAGRTYFLAAVEGGTVGAELWATDGTAAGTAPVFTEGSSPRPHEADGLLAWNGALYFFAREGAAGPVALWRSDGTAAGTARFGRFLRPLGVGPSFLGAVGDRLAFRADDGVHGAELWATDGSAAGTRLVADIRPGPAGSFSFWLQPAAGLLYFSAHDGVHGLELWATDGTTAGTRLAADLFPGAPSGAPEELTQVGSSLLFTADDGLHGREPWELPLAAAPCAPAPGALCLEDDRVRAEVFWRSTPGAWRPAERALPLAAGSEAGAFGLSPGAGVDLALRLAPGREGTALYLAGLTTREWALVLTDLASGARRRFFNPAGRLGSLAIPDGLSSGSAATDLSLPASPSLSGRAIGSGRQGACPPDPGTLCLLERFAVEASWRVPGGPERLAPALPLDGASGAWAVRGPARPGLVVKMVDGRAVNGRFWLFGGSLTTLEVTLTATDTTSGSRRVYVKPAGQAVSFADLAAF
jgi:ELWxxDGT repeat protein